MKAVKTRNNIQYSDLFSNRLINNDYLHQEFNTKIKEKLETLELELEYTKNIVFKLKRELASKDKEISLLKVNINKKAEQNQKNIQLIEGILKQCDQSTITGFNLIENKISNSDFDNKNKNEQFNSIPKVGNLLHFTSKQKK